MNQSTNTDTPKLPIIYKGRVIGQSDDGRIFAKTESGYYYCNTVEYAKAYLDYVLRDRHSEKVTK